MPPFSCNRLSASRNGWQNNLSLLIFNQEENSLKMFVRLQKYKHCVFVCGRSLFNSDAVHFHTSHILFLRLPYDEFDDIAKLHCNFKGNFFLANKTAAWETGLLRSPLHALKKTGLIMWLCNTIACSYRLYSCAYSRATVRLPFAYYQRGSLKPPWRLTVTEALCLNKPTDLERRGSAGGGVLKQLRRWDLQEHFSWVCFRAYKVKR